MNLQATCGQRAEGVGENPERNPCGSEDEEDHGAKTTTGILREVTCERGTERGTTRGKNGSSRDVLGN